MTLSDAREVAARSARAARQFPVHAIDRPAPPGLGGLFSIEPVEQMLGGHTIDGVPHRHDFVEVIYITAGSGTHVVDFHEYTIVPDQIFVIAAGQVHEWRTSREVEGLLVLFHEEFATWPLGVPSQTRALPTFGVQGLRPSDSQAARIRRLLTAMVDQYRHPGQTQGLALQGLLLVLMLECGTLLPPATGQDSSLSRSFARVAARSISAEATVSDCARHLGVTPSQLYRAVLQETGRTPSAMLRGALTLEAQRLLVGSDLSSSRIAALLGFSNASYFSRYFRRETGTTPSEYRRRRAQRTPTSSAPRAPHG